MYLDVVGKPAIVFNSMKSAFEILERRANNSSGRPRFIVAHEVINSGLALAFMDHGDLWVLPKQTMDCPALSTLVRFLQLAPHASCCTGSSHKDGSAALPPYPDKGGNYIGFHAPIKS